MRFFLAVLLLVPICAAELTPAQQKLNADSFEYAWKMIRDKMWEPMPNGLDWQKVHDELLPKVQKAKTMAEARAVMRDMISRLNMTHFNIVAADVYDSVDNPSRGDGAPGFELRVLDGVPVVTHVEDGSPAQRVGVDKGWEILAVDGKPVEPVIKRVNEAYEKSTTRELILARSVLGMLTGGVGQKLKVTFLDGKDQQKTLDIELIAPRGGVTKFGYLPAQHVYYESGKIGNIGYIHFNMFLDPVRISSQFADSMQSCMKCDGIIVDLRGNPGGLGGMAMGMAGWFISNGENRLGVMKMKDQNLDFRVFPKPDVYKGPVVMLTDGLTGSTSEILEGGMKDLGRAHIVGTRSAGAALPSMFERLPNGDGFQYAIANYISEGGKPLEGIGVIPDEEVKLTRKALLTGDDAVMDAAVAWIRKQKEKQ